MLKEKIIKIKDIKIGDKVMGSDKKWKLVVNKTPLHFPTKMYKISFTNGYIECSGDHQWTLFKDTEVGWTVETNYINENLEELKNWKVGSLTGPEVISIEEIDSKESMCITTDASDMLFEIILNQDIETKEFNIERPSKQ